MEKNYEHYEIAASEDSYRVRSDTVAQITATKLGALSKLILWIAKTF